MHNPVRSSLRHSPFQVVDTDFYIPQLPVAIINNQCGAVAGTSRSLLESCGCTVQLHGVGTPLDFLKVIKQTEGAPRYLLIHSHGLPEGLHFGSYRGVPDAQISMLKDECLPPEVIGRHVRLPGTTILNLSCHAGRDDMAQAFLSGGATAYLGSHHAIGMVQQFFLVNFIFGVLVKGLSDKEAWQNAIEATGHEDADSILFFDSTGKWGARPVSER